MFWTPRNGDVSEFDNSDLTLAEFTLMLVYDNTLQMIKGNDYAMNQNMYS